MPNQRHSMPLLIYYILVSSLTTLVLTAIAALLHDLFFPEPLFDTSTIVIILIFLLFKSILLGFVLHSMHKQGRVNQASGTRFIGYYYGRLYGSVMGALVGGHVASVVGFIVGGVLFYFAGRWLGSKLSNLIGCLFDHNLPDADKTELVVARPLRSRRFLITVYAGIFPILWVLMALYFKSADITIGATPSPWLATARWVVIAISIYSIAAPWLIKRQMSRRRKPIRPIDMFWLGLGLSVIPTIYGFFLFLMGASIVELGCFAVASSLAAIIWSTKSKTETNSKELTQGEDNE